MAPVKKSKPKKASIKPALDASVSESTREDLQGTIEELQSSNEEVMSMNEELTTVNSRLQDKVEALERANNDFGNLLNSTAIATVFLDLDLRIRRFTPATAPLLHLIETDVGRPIGDFALRFTDQTLLADARHVLDRLTPAENEFQGEEGRWFLRRILPCRTAGNQIEGVAVTFVDITERMRSEAQSRRLAGILRDSNDAVILLEADGRITEWNRGAERLYGHSAAEALSLNLGDLVPRDERGEVENLLQRIVRGEEIKSFETRGITKDGRTLEAWSTITRITDERGLLTALAVTSHDITPQKRAEATLAETGRRMRAIVNTAADAIITIGERGLIDSFNPAAEKMFGYPREEVIGQNVSLLMPSPHREQHDQHLARYLESGVPRIIGIGREAVGRRRDGSTFPIDLAVSEHRDGAQQLYTGIIRDLSERKALQRELLTIAADEQRRIGQDLHDSVGQKLTGLAMLAGSLEQSLLGHSPAEAKLASRIALGLENALAQVRQLSKGLVPVTVDVEGLSAALTELAETTTYDSGVNCAFDCGHPVHVENNETATNLYCIAQEAVTNALKHGAPRQVKILLEEEGSKITLSVRDDGRGISAGDWQTQGLGLKTMQYRAALIGATLSVVPLKKRGTLVTCCLMENRVHG